MKRDNINIKKAFLLFLCGVVMTACGYEEIVSMDYPDSKYIYQLQLMAFM